jgi:hypothetical protein
MKIIEEGTITITADSELSVEGFTVKNGSLNDLAKLAVARCEVALGRAKRSILVGGYRRASKVRR